MLTGKYPEGRHHMILIASQSLASESVCQIFEEIYDPALLIDPEKGTFVGANTAACEYLGYSAGELARNHGGDLTLVDTGPAGSVFRLELPHRGMALDAASPTPS